MAYLYPYSTQRICDLTSLTDRDLILLGNTGEMSTLTQETSSCSFESRNLGFTHKCARYEAANAIFLISKVGCVCEIQVKKYCI